jgi:hypothetical protein
VLIVLLKAEQHSLFDAVVPVKGHATKQGVYVQPHQAKRKKKLPEAPAGDLFAEQPKPEPKPEPPDPKALKDAVGWYQGIGFFSINTLLRKGESVLIKRRLGDKHAGPNEIEHERERIARVKDKIQTLDAAFAARDPEDVDVWRGSQTDTHETGLLSRIIAQAGVKPDGFDLKKGRGVLDPDKVARLGERLKGVAFEDKGFVSTSRSQTIGGGFAGIIPITPDDDEDAGGVWASNARVVYHITGKVRALPMTEVYGGDSGPEQETLLARGTRFRVKGARALERKIGQPPTIAIELEVIP